MLLLSPTTQQLADVSHSPKQQADQRLTKASCQQLLLHLLSICSTLQAADMTITVWP